MECISRVCSKGVDPDREQLLSVDSTVVSAPNNTPLGPHILDGCFGPWWAAGPPTRAVLHV